MKADILKTACVVTACIVLGLLIATFAATCETMP